MTFGTVGEKCALCMMLVDERRVVNVETRRTHGKDILT
jgi:hypothetical protein